MLTFSIAYRDTKDSLPLPLSTTYQYRIDNSKGGKLVNDTRIASQAVPDEIFHSPLVYAYEAQVERIYYRVTDRVVEDAQMSREIHLLNIFISREIDAPSIVIGSAGKVRQALDALEECVANEGIANGSPKFTIPEFDLKKVVQELKSDQWFRGFRREGNIRGGKLFGEGIELDQIYELIEQDSEPNEVGVTLSVKNAKLMVRLLRNGRIQFYNFSDKHLWDRNHDVFGDPWPLIIETLDFLKRYVV